MLRDETLIDLAGSNPKTLDDFSAIRNFPGGKDGKLAPPILKILHNVAALPDSDLPAPLSHSHVKKPPAAIMELFAGFAETCHRRTKYCPALDRVSR